MKRFMPVVATLLATLFILTSACAGPAPGPGPAPGGETQIVKIGVLQPTSGGLGALGVSHFQGCQLAMKHINEDGGFDINGTHCTLELMEYDDRGDPKLTVTGAAQMIDAGIPVILGPVMGEQSFAAQAVTEPAHVSIIGYNIDPELIGEGKNYTFGGDTRNERVLYRAPYYVEHLGVETCVFLTENVTYWSATSDLTIQEFEKLGCEVLANEIFEPDTTDFYTHLTKLKDLGADALYLCASPMSTANIVKQRLELDWPVVVLGTDVMYGTGSPFFEAAGMAAEGNIEESFFFDPYQEMTPWLVDKLGLDLAKRERFVEASIAEYGIADFSPYQAIFYDFVYLTVEAMKRAGSWTDRDAIHYELERTDYVGAGAHYQFHPENHRTTYTRVFVRLHVDDPEKVEYHVELLAAATPLNPLYTEWEITILKELNIKDLRAAAGY